MAGALTPQITSGRLLGGPPGRWHCSCPGVDRWAYCRRVTMGARSPRTIQTQGAAIRISASGSGEPACVFLHYWGGSGRTWDDVIDRIDGRARCVAVDQRGWGESIATDGRY